MVVLKVQSMVALMVAPTVGTMAEQRAARKAVM